MYTWQMYIYFLSLWHFFLFTRVNLYIWCNGIWLDISHFCSTLNFSKWKIFILLFSLWILYITIRFWCKCRKKWR